MDLRSQQIKDSYGNLVTIGTTLGAPTTGFLQNGQGSNVTALTTTSMSLEGGLVINESGANVDFRVEGDTDQNLLFVDASTDRVGIRTNAPAAGLHIAGSADIRLTNTANTSGFDIGLLGGSSDATAYVYQRANSTMVLGTNNTERMRITSSGRVGIGTSSPATGLEVGTTGYTYSGTNYDIYGLFGGSGIGGIRLGNDSVSGAGVIGNAGQNPIVFVTYNGSSWGERMRIDSSGNVGIGVTPPSSSSTAGIFMSGVTNIFGSTTNGITFAANTYRDAGVFKYVSSSTASRYSQEAGAHSWFTAGTGTADATITFTQAMTLDAPVTPRLLIGTTTAGVGSNNNTNLTVAGGSTVYQSVLASGGQELYLLAQSGAVGVYARSNDPMLFGVNNAEKVRITSAGNVKIGGTADRATTEGTAQLVLFNGTAPVGTLANGVSFYSASGEANVMDAAGNATLLSPHDKDTNEWIFRSKHTPTGKVLKIDVERMLRFINDHFGLDMIEEFTEA